MEKLTQAINLPVNAGKWRGFRTSRNALEILCLFFIDDMLLFVVASMEHIDDVRAYAIHPSMFQSFMEEDVSDWICANLHGDVQFYAIMTY
ncbi:hypothetical protein V6N12_016130 [Hibiscus sabdariffa]|uniref:Uncharacterized protein n=1 Tax=Hibiscus sabdariffa TaxID=183260 RepID=A0ABR2C8T3_9ROSI